MARQVEAIVKGLTRNDKVDLALIQKALHDYATLISPWAKSVAEYMLQDVARRDAKAWRQHSREMGVALRAEIEQAPTGALMRQFMDEAVTLIKSLPLQAAEQVHEMVIKNMADGRRASSMVADVMALGTKTTARARLIARTETARAAATLTQARAQYVGSEGYIWRTAGDLDVRDSHAEMEGRYVRWDTPPKLSDGTVTHAGMIYNCRCWAEPVLPED